MHSADNAEMGLLKHAAKHSGTLSSWREAALSLTRQSGGVCFGEFIRTCRMPIRGAILVLRSLLDEGLLKVGPEGLLQPTEPSHGQAHQQYCPLCRKRFDRLDSESRLFLDKLAELVETRPAECLLFGQRVIDNFGVLDRVAALRLNGHLNGKRIVLLGDDDLVSLGIAMLGTPDRLTVLDLDERLLSFIQGTADRFGLALEAVCYDCADQLPADFSASYDVVLCDPYPTYDASFEAFFWTQTRGLLDPRGDRSVYSFVAPSHKPPDFADASLAWIGKNGGISVERVSGFNAYLLIEGELTGAEASCLQGLVWEPKLSHTKDLVRFEWSVSEDASIPDGAARPSGQPRTDETMGWIDGVLGHALVTTMGVEEQLQIATAATAHTPRWQGALRPLGQHGTASVGGRSGLRSRGTITVKLDGLIFEIWGASKLQEWQARPGDVASLLSTTEAGALELTPADLCFLTELHHSGVQPVDVEAGRRADLFSLTRLFESYHRSTVKAAF